MGSKISPTTIGAFVVSAIVLAVAGVSSLAAVNSFRKSCPLSCSLIAPSWA